MKSSFCYNETSLHNYLFFNLNNLSLHFVLNSKPDYSEYVKEISRKF